jgi:thiol:disulfide interchange protein DsbA
MRSIYKHLFAFSLVAMFMVACTDEKPVETSKDAAVEQVDKVAEEQVQNAVATPEQESSAEAVKTAEATPPAEQEQEVSTENTAAKAEMQFAEGRDYIELNPLLPTTAPEGQVEVTELFWYGCPHCYHLEPVIEKYLKEKPEYVSFTRVPGTLNPNWNYHAKLYYVGQMLDPDGSKKVHTNIFNAMHQQRRRLMDDESAKQFLISLGFTEDKVNAAMNSLELNAALDRAMDYNKKSNAGSVPTLIVNGRYLTSPSMARGGVRMVRLINHLAELEHKAKEE